MGLFDYVKLNHPMFGDDCGHEGKTKEFLDPYMEHYEINETGRLLYEETRIEDHGDKSAPEGSIARLSGCMTQVPTGEHADMNWHGYLWVWGKGDYMWKCKFTDGQLVAAEKAAPI